MFTGIVEETGKIREVGADYLTIAAGKVLDGTKLGDSINVNGACLTVKRLMEGTFLVDLMPETRRRTNLGNLHYGDLVNLERAMPAGGRFGGHLVQGHVDGAGRVMSVRPEEKAKLLAVSVPPELVRYIVPKGFVAVDGVSLTVVNCVDAAFTVSLVAFTMEHTTLGGMSPGNAVNIEVDIIGKYVEKLISGKPGELTLGFLEQHGFSRKG
ncbi:MAG: riboflavin synthase [Chloroflexota bacterium]